MIVSKPHKGVGVSRKDPESANNVVSNHVISLALISQQFLEGLLASAVNEFSGKVVLLHEIHDSERIGVVRQLEAISLVVRDQIKEEVLGFLLAVFASEFTTN